MMKFKKVLTRPGYEVSTIEDIPTKKIPTIRDLAKFTGGFETFRPDIYQLEKSDGSGLQDLTGYGFADKDSLEMARKGEMTKEVADNRLISILEKEKQNWLQYLPETSKLPIETQMALWDTSYNGKGVQETIKNSPKLVQAIKNYLPGNRKLLEAVVEQMDHSKSAGGWLGARSSARRAMALGEYDWNWPTLDKYGRQVDYDKYKGPKDYLSSPYIGKYQSGGSIKSLIYKPYIQENDSDNYINNYINDVFTSGEPSKYSVDPIKIVTPETSTKQQIVTTQQPEVIQQTVVQEQAPIEAKTDPAIVTNQNESVDKQIGKQYKFSERDEFKNTIYNAYYKSLIKRGVSKNKAERFAKRFSAQDANESNWGMSSLSKDFNFGGIKDFRKNTNAAVKDTTEYKNGVKQTMKQPFRKFGSLDEYIDYKISMMHKNWGVLDHDPDEMYSLITKGKRKYATAPNYANILENWYNKMWK